MNEKQMKYRANVAAILRNAKGRILVCERLGLAGAWQFPQGGLHKGETPEQALRRELSEEIGVPSESYSVAIRKGPYRYLFGEGRTKKGWDGQEQFYFLCDFAAPESNVNVATEHPEFQAFRWIRPAEFQIAWLPEMKREVYRTVFRDFFQIEI
jgi:putative (di)nucleoside polyphosphate hydrolase